MGTPGRSKSFHYVYYGDMGDNGIPDHIATIKQPAERHSWMDTSRVGIWGHSGGGFVTTRAILKYPYYYKVAVSGAGNHDNRNYEADWGEKWHGLLKKKRTSIKIRLKPTSRAIIMTNRRNQLLAENLRASSLLLTE